MKLSIMSNNDINIRETKILTASVTYGIGLLSYLQLMCCHIFGLACTMYDDKIEKAKKEAFNKLIEKSKEISAKGIKNIRIQVTGITVFVYGEAFWE